MYSPPAAFPESAPKQEYHLIEVGFFDESVWPDHLQELLLAYHLSWLFDEFRRDTRDRRQRDHLVLHDQGAGDRIEPIRPKLIGGGVACQHGGYFTRKLIVS